MEYSDVKIIMDDIVLALDKAGYNPFDQISAYLKLNNPEYIIRKKMQEKKYKS